MACYRVTVLVHAAKPGGAPEQTRWKYTFYTNRNPETDPELIKDITEPLTIVSIPAQLGDRQKRRLPTRCQLKVKDYASKGFWVTSYDKTDVTTPDTAIYSKPTISYGAVPPWGGIEVFYRADYDSVGDGFCEEGYVPQSTPYNSLEYVSDDPDCQCSFGNSSLTGFPSLIGPLGLDFKKQSEEEVTLKDFLTHLESLRDSCIDGGGQKFTLQFACLPKGIALERFSLPTGWDTLSDAQKNAFIDSKVTILQKTLGQKYYQLITLKTQCLPSSGTVINGHIYQQ